MNIEYVRVTKLGLWLRWVFTWHSNTMSWHEIKQLAVDNRLCRKCDGKIIVYSFK